MSQTSNNKKTEVKKRLTKKQFPNTRPRRQLKKDENTIEKEVNNHRKVFTKRQSENAVYNDLTGYSPDVATQISNPSIAIEVPILEEAIGSMAIGPVSLAVSRGWSETVPSDYPVQAYRYLCLLLAQAINNTIPQTATGPKWLALIMQGLVQKTVPSRGGAISYKFTFDMPNGYPSAVAATRDIGPTVYGKKVNYGVKTATPVNGYFREIDTNIPWDIEDALAAYTSLYSYLAVLFGNGGTHRKVNLSDTNEMTKDPSMFSYPILKYGGSGSATGGFYSIAVNEIPIRSPMFAAMVSDGSATSNALRGVTCPRSKAGDATFAVGSLLNIIKEHQIHYKTPPRFKAVDFMRFFEVLVLWVNKVQNKAAQDTETSLNPADLVCPLTLQELALLLRNEMMRSFAGTQPHVQSLFPRQTSNGNANEFVAFASGVGTSPYGQVFMQMPRLFKENIQALRSWISLGSRGKDRQPVLYIPVLGKYVKDELSYKDYTYSNGEPETPKYLSFADPQVKSGVGKTQKIVSAEVLIDIIDGLSGGGTYVAINDPGALGTLSTLWNGWINKIRNYTISLATNTNDGGINVLRSIGMTDHWFTEVKERTLVTDDFYGNREKRYGEVIPSSPYFQRRLEVVTSQVLFINGTWNGVQSMFIRPTNLIIPAALPGQNSSYAAVGTETGELNQLVSSYGEGRGYTLAEAHDVYASAMVKDKFGEKSVLDIQLDALEEKGHAGILSTLADAFFPGAGAILGTLGI